MKWGNQRVVYLFVIVGVITTIFHVCAYAGEWPLELHVYEGSTPTVDGVISPGEYDDALLLNSYPQWMSRFSPVTDPADCSAKVWIKHDGENLYFAFEVTDDVLYGIDTERWLPELNPKAHKISPEGWPWFGDGIEVFMNPAYRWWEQETRGEGDKWRHVEHNAGNGQSWQMVVNLTKSLLGGVGQGGLLQGEPRINPNAFQTYTDWIQSGAMKAATRVHEDKKGYTIELMVKANPCLEVQPGVFWSPDYGTAKIGFNLAIQDLDEKEKGEGNFGNIHHEGWLAGGKQYPYLPKYWGTLYLHPSKRPHEIHLSLSGDDTNPGTQDKPVRSLVAAQQRVRELTEAGLDRDVLVLMHGGTYTLNAPLYFGARDGGTDQYAVTYAAAPGYSWPGDVVHISGGRTISGWQDKGDNLWSLTIKDTNFPIEQLWKNGERLARSRYPEESDAFLHIESIRDELKTFTFNEPLPEIDISGTDIEMTCVCSWSIARGLIDTMSAEEVKTKTAMGWIGHCCCLAKPGYPVYFENHPDFLTQPGTWCFTSATGELLYLAEDGEDPNQQTFVIPELERLVIVEGSADEPVQNLHFVGLSFKHTAFPMPEFGHRDIQGGYHGTSCVPPEPVFAPPAAIEMRFADDCRLELCTVAHTGASGIGVGAGCRNISIVGNHVYDVGANGIDIGHKTGPVLSPSNILDKEWDTPREIPLNNRVCNNIVERCAQIAKSASGIFASFVEGTTISHNRVNDMPYGGISLGFKWDTQPSSMKNNTIEYNHVFDVMKEIADNGGIYTLGWQPGTLIRGNLIHDVHRSSYAFGGGNNGFFIDEGSKEITFEENIVFDIRQANVRHNQNERDWHTWINNYFGVRTSDPAFPWHKAALAGLEPAYRNKVGIGQK